MPSPPTTPKRPSTGRSPPVQQDSIPSPPPSFLLAPRFESDFLEHETTLSLVTQRKPRHGRGKSNSPRKPLTLPDEAPFPDILPPNYRLPPRPSELVDNPIESSTTTQETSPSRLTTFTSPLARIAAVKHARSQSFSMGFSGDSQTGSAAAKLFTNIFKTPETIPQDSEKKAFFGFSFQSTQSPTQTAKCTTKTTDVLDEFAGLSFSALLRSYLEEPIGTPNSPEEALKRTPEGRLEDAVSTATDLLDRVYSAYCARTSSLAEALGECEVQKEDIACEKVHCEQLKSQLERLAFEEREARDAQTQRLQEQRQRIQHLEAELAKEQRKRAALEEEIRTIPLRKVGNRASAASDSGFESDTESMLSRVDVRASVVVSPTEGLLDRGDEVNSNTERGDRAATTLCESCRQRDEARGGGLAAVGAATKVPTPLREAWSPSENPAKKAVWGFFKSRQQSQQTWENGRNEGDIDSIKMEINTSGREYGR
jgi:ABC-type phosphate transport system auxiliary subunit